jgi:hypothetical protein
MSAEVVFERVGGKELAARTGAAPVILTDDYAPVDRLIGVR